MKYILGLVILFTVSLGEAQNARTKAERQSLEIKRSKIELPKAVLQQRKVSPRDMRKVQPPTSRKFYGRGTMEAEYERLVDEEIRRLYKLSKQYKRSKNRGEIWLRLAERYIEKSRLIEFKIQDDFEARTKKYESGKSKTKPTMSSRVPQEYNKKAIELYDWFIRDFPRDPKVDQALYFLGYAHFETNNPTKGEQYYKKLVADYPNSEYVSESYFALGEFYFENERWEEALENYARVIRRKNSRLYTFALYKAAWCFFRTNKVDTALKTLERVIFVSREGGDDSEPGTRSVNRIQLAQEAMKDYVPFYAESSSYKSAEEDFRRVTRNEAHATKMLEQLATLYVTAGNREGARFIYQKLIAKNPNAERAAFFQQQIVLTYLNTEDHKTLKVELFEWITRFGPESDWAKANASNKKVIDEAFKMQETTLRNRTLQLHQTAQNSRAKFSQTEAEASYKLYLRFFEKAPQYGEMRFYYGELLFDMEKGKEAAQQYAWYVKNQPKGKFFERASINVLLAFESELPTPEELEKRRKGLAKPNDRLPFDESTKGFVEASRFYLTNFPKGEKAPEVRRRLGALYYQHNHYDEALAVFDEIIQKKPWTKDSQIAAELTLDIYKLREDLDGFQKASYRFLEIPEVARSQFGKDIKVNLQKAALLDADRLSKSGKNDEAAKAFEKFALKNMNTTAGQTAAYNAANNYQKTGDLDSASKMFYAFLKAPSNDKGVQKLKLDARSSLADIYRKTGRLEEAAREYSTFAKENGKDPKSASAHFNAATIWDSLNQYELAYENYHLWYQAARGVEKNEVHFYLGDLDFRRRRYGPARANFERYIEARTSNAERVMKAHYYAYQASLKLGHPTKSVEWAQKTYQVYQSLKGRGKAAGVRYAAEAKFNLSSVALDEMKRVRLGSTEKTIVGGLKTMQDLQKKMVKNMVDVVKLDYGPYVIAAMLTEAQAYEIIANSFESSPVPREYAGPDQAKQYKDLAKKEADNFRQKAKAIYEKSYSRARELEALSEWTVLAQKGVGRYNPQNSPSAGERVKLTQNLDGGGL